MNNVKCPLCYLIVFVTCFTDIPAQVPPLTPGTNKKMTEALKGTFASWEKEQNRHNIPKGNFYLFFYIII
jgi:hypothetical protein